ncbi:allantoate permease [Xylariaceae sp. FL0255]|nr:allantoate permease [Xylariaceae sp. FL0255]
MEDVKVEEHKPASTKGSNEELEHQKNVIEASKRRGIDEEEIALFQGFMNADADYHRKMKRKLMRKVDFHLLPLLILMYLFNFIDRNNLSQARLGTLEQDLGLKGTDFNLATSILFVGYLIMQLPSNLLITRARPSLFLGTAMTIWGIISTSQAATRNRTDLIVARFFLGFAEAPFFPGAIFLMSSWYTRAEMTHRVAWFYSGSSLANAFGGLIGAGVIGNLSGAHGIAGWRWLFIIEGSITIGLALTSIFVLPNYPATTKWLTHEEQAYAQWRLVEDTGEADLAGTISLKEGLKMAITDPRLWLFTLLQHVSIVSQAFQYFFPTIVKTLGYGSVETLLLTVPAWVATFLVSLLVTYTSGRFGDRSIHIMCLMVLAVAGNIIAISTLNAGARFFAVFLLPVGAVSAYQIIVAWVANSFPRPLVKRSACISIANLLGNAGNIYGSYLYPSSEGPRYLQGGIATAVFAFAVAVLAFTVRMVLARQNKKLAEKEVLDTDGRVLNLHSDNQEAGAVGFRYIL